MVHCMCSCVSEYIESTWCDVRAQAHRGSVSSNVSSTVCTVQHTMLCNTQCSTVCCSIQHTVQYSTAHTEQHSTHTQYVTQHQPDLIFLNKLGMLSSSKGSVPHSSAYRITPIDHTSTSAPAYRLPLMTYNCMCVYLWGVCVCVCVCVWEGMGWRWRGVCLYEEFVYVKSLCLCVCVVRGV